MTLSPHSPRRQRKALYTADAFERRRRMTVPLSRDLRRRIRARSVPIRKGDTVRVLGGSFVGREERVARIDRRAYSVVLDNVTVKTGEDKLKPLPIRLSHLVITRLNLSDAWRRRSLRVADEDVSPEERGEPPEAEAPAGAPAPATPAEDSPAPTASPRPRRRRASATPSDEPEAAP
ncbi:MAG TPA: 50S ribosomal protein L24 [Thermoplasmata archaeon]|nr:50S ribosomal protein L24 [Thermoplasmata archaeon]